MTGFRTGSSVALSVSFIIGSLAGCAHVRAGLKPLRGATCKRHAFVGEEDVASFTTGRFGKGSHARAGVVPFVSDPAASGRSADWPGEGRTLAALVRDKLVEHGGVPIVELFDREDGWGRREDFDTGNFRAVREAYDAGYDLLVVGRVAPRHDRDAVTAYARLVDTASGSTVWSGRATASTAGRTVARLLDRAGVGTYHPAASYDHELLEELSGCLAEGITIGRGDS